MKLLMIDNYDSFTYNLVHIIEELGHEIDIFRNDKISLEEVGKYDKILLSPGPGIPSEAGILLDVIKTYSATKSILGICLGHQAICEVFGAKLENMKEVLHGIDSEITITKPDVLFKGLPKNFKIGHYHSWRVANNSIPIELEVTAIDTRNQIMGIVHKKYDVRGLQFHPESILTEHGKQLIANWINN
jgi:anthranilate synthase component 2